MSRASLGKRTRSVQNQGKLITASFQWPFLTASLDLVELPAKRTRRQTRAASENEENVDPEATALPDVENELDDIYVAPASKRLRRSHSQTFSKTIPITPQTPRHRDVFANSPSTPRQVVKSAGKLFQRLTPQSPLTPGSLQTVYHSARQLFARGADPGELVGREKEREQLAQFVQRCSSTTPNGCLYVSGPPGTGKSAMVKGITERPARETAVRQAYVNCMSIKSSKDLYNTLLELLGHESDLSEAVAMEELQKIFVTKKKGSPVYLLVLDEIDHILTMGLESLYRLFEWSLQQPSRLVLIGIANALDLTARFLPRLKSKNLKPDLLPFHPYSAAQIKSIITTRLMTLLPTDSSNKILPFFHPAAIELCSRKVSSQTGDLRKAFEICRRALDIVESETRRQHENEAREKVLQMTPSRKPLDENLNMAGPGSSGSSRSVSHVAATSLKALTAESAPRVLLKHLNQVTQAAFSNGTNQRLKALNLQQKAALCSLVALEKRNRALRMTAAPSTPTKSQMMAPTVKTLFETYSILCTRDSVLHPLSSSEFREVIGSLETLGLVNPVDGKTGGLIMTQTPSKRGRKAALPTGEDKRVASCVGEKEMENIAEGVGAGILSSILSGEALD
ncbi:cell division control protein [Colletotrichum orchidophilum]|uniref:Cell division control protein n=1 Tax=Colletotrichum orchidophilum TaxID=1209926 RepID=A0A1G4BJ06_9PEZI|nr:cell division control protein [Colletotrichum orchidophilum]OHF01278.1 cell division control protein [Colletotrichum orchidophilum]